RDCEPGREGGIWLGASETGKISCLLNIFQPIEAFKQNTTGRGFLALNFLQNNFSSQDYVNTIKESNIKYNLFNLLLLEYRRNSYEASYFNNVDNTSTNLDTDKVHGFGNCLISNDFKKIERGKKFFGEVIKNYGTKEKETDLKDSLFEMMAKRDPFYPDEQLSTQGRGYDEYFIKGLSSIWIAMPEARYGTRTTTVILVDSNNRLTFSERTMETPSADCKDFLNSDFTMDLKIQNKL
ncbi:Transport and Golgi organization protein 2, partial [Armadillidium nasatum]